MKIISLHNGHDASITALEDGKILGHWELERVLNIKHFCGVDHGDEIYTTLIGHVLPRLDWKVEDIDYVVFAGCTEWKRTTFYGSVPLYDKFDKQRPYATGTILLGSKSIPCAAIAHHVNHMAYAYYTSPFVNSMIFTWDGIGDGTSTMSGYGKDNKIHVSHIYSKDPPIGTSNNGVGLFYSYLGRLFPFLGGDLLATAGKAMGLSSYGEPQDNWRPQVRHTIREWMPRPEQLISMLSLNPEDLKSPTSKIAQNLMATIQDELELYLLETVSAMQDEYLHSGVNTKNVCMAGGCALNVQANSRLLSRDSNNTITHVYVPPATSDCGISIGAALYVWHNILDNEFNGIDWHSPYLGDRIYNAPSLENIDSIMDKYPGLDYKILESESVTKIAAELLHSGKIIAWAQGRAEIGPRALGNRSILSSAAPTNPDNDSWIEKWKKDGGGTFKLTINEKVKHREYWRPFAPIALIGDALEYFDIDHPSPYMLESPLVRDWNTQGHGEFWKKIPAVVHVDGTCRVQTVSSMTNPLMNFLLQEYKKLSGVGILLNTSLNDRGRPIANTTEDILNLLRDSELDYAFIGPFMFWKK